MNKVRTRWFGWIPTNRGKLNFSFIELPTPGSIPLKSKNTEFSYTENKKNYINLDLSYLSDSYGYKRFFKFSGKNSGVEYPATANVELEDKTTKIQGNIEIIYKEFCRLSTKFTCEQNGVVEFENIFYDIDSIDNELKEIKSIFYVLLKTIIHGDAHHHQKIDVALPITEKKFYPSVISSSLLDYIKLVERNVKITKECHSLFRNENLTFEIEGYLSYFRTFTLLFGEDAVKRDYEFAQSVIMSLKNTVGKRKNKEELMNGIKTASITFLGLIISINILLNGFWLQGHNNLAIDLSSQNRYYYFLGSVFLVVVMFFKYTECKFKSYLYYNYYNLFEFLVLIKNADFHDLNWEGKLFKLVPAIILLFFLTGLFLLLSQ